MVPHAGLHLVAAVAHVGPTAKSCLLAVGHGAACIPSVLAHHIVVMHLNINCMYTCLQEQR
jgi:hypothetical protein